MKGIASGRNEIDPGMLSRLGASPIRDATVGCIYLDGGVRVRLVARVRHLGVSVSCSHNSRLPAVAGQIFVSYLLSSFLFCAYGVLVADLPGIAGKGMSGPKKNDERVPGSCSTKSTAGKTEDPGAANVASGNDFVDGVHGALENGEEAKVDM